MIHHADVSCKLLACKTARCNKYAKRKKHVPDCMLLTTHNLSMLSWMPKSCAYRLIHENKDLPDWRPLATGNLDSTRLAGHSMATRVVTETSIDEDDLPEHIKNW